jgi:hypothetical protein
VGSGDRLMKERRGEVRCERGGFGSVQFIVGDHSGVCGRSQLLMRVDAAKIDSIETYRWISHQMI